MSLTSPHSVSYDSGEMERRVKQFHFVKRFSLSDNKLLMWNKKTILQGNVGQVSEKGEAFVEKILLEIAQLTDCLSVHRQEKKLRKMIYS